MLRRWVLLLGVEILRAQATGADVDLASCELSAPALASAGLGALEDGQFAAARRLLAAAHELAPEHADLAALLCEAEARVIGDAAARLQAALERGDAAAARRHVQEASRLRPDAPEVARAASMLGMRAYGEEWLEPDEIVRREKTAMHLADARRRGLGLGDRFLLSRRRGVRLWSDGAVGAAALARLERLAGLAEAAHRSRFAPLGAEASAEGLDVVLFGSRAAFAAYTGEPAAAGAFLSGRLVSCVLVEGLDPRGPDLDAAFLHELSHQLDRRVLELRAVPVWLDEALALDFEAAELAASGARLVLGRRLPSGLNLLRRRHGPRSEGWQGVAALVAAGDAARRGEAARVHAFYVESWLLLRFLRDELPRGRSVLGDFLRELRRARGLPSSPDAAFRGALSRHGWDLGALEGRFRAFAAEACQER